MTAKEKRTLAQLIREFRQHLGLSQAKFGHYLNPSKPLSEKTISAFETGARFPSRKSWSLIVVKAKAHDFPLKVSQLYDE